MSYSTKKEIEKENINRINSRLLKYKETSSVLCDHDVLIRGKGRILQAIVHSIILLGQRVG